MSPARRSPRRDARQRAELESQRRRDGRHCPVCLAVLPRMSGAVARTCPRCGAQPDPDHRCAECHMSAVWLGRAGAACASCGHHGSKVRVIAGLDWIGDEPEES